MFFNKKDGPQFYACDIILIVRIILDHKKSCNLFRLQRQNPASLEADEKKAESFQAYAWRPDQEPAMKYKEAPGKICKYRHPTGTFHQFHCKSHFYLVGFHAYLLKYNVVE